MQSTFNAAQPSVQFSGIFNRKKKKEAAEAAKRAEQAQQAQQSQRPLPPHPQEKTDAAKQGRQWGYSIGADVVDVVPFVGDVVSWMRTGRLIKKARTEGVDEKYVKKMKRVRWVDVLSTPAAWMVGLPFADAFIPTNTINQNIYEKGLEDRDARNWHVEHNRKHQNPIVDFPEENAKKPKK